MSINEKNHDEFAEYFHSTASESDFENEYFVDADEEDGLHDEDDEEFGEEEEI